MNAFKKVAKKTKKTKKSTMPEISANNMQRKIICDFIKAKGNKNTAEAIIKKSEGLLMDDVTDKHVDICREDDKFYGSVKLVDENSGNKMTFTFTNKYSNIPSDEADTLKEHYGNRTFKRFFEEHMVVTLTKTALNDENFCNQLAKKLGNDFEKYFSVKTFYKPKESYHAARVLDKELAEKHETISDIVNANKPSIKVG